MFTNPITGRTLIFTRYPPCEEEIDTPDASITIAIIIYIIVGPFWLIGKFVKHVTEKMLIHSNQDNRRTRKLV